MASTSTLPHPTTSSASNNNPVKPEPVTVAFTVGNTYRRLSPSEASYDKLTGRHLKIHDWTLYVDVLPGQDPDIIDRVTFDMRDDSFASTAFTCHCPIRIRNDSGSSFVGRISGGDNRNNSQRQMGQSTEEGGGERMKSQSAVAVGSVSKRPHPNQSRWRFSTRQQTFGAVNVQINIRGRGGCRCTVPYEIVLDPCGYECPVDSLPLFVEKRPHQQLKPLKMMDSSFSLDMYFGLDGSVSTQSSLYETAKSVYSRSKIPIRLLLEDGEVEDFANKPNKPSSKASIPWLVKLVRSASDASCKRSSDADASIISMSSPNLAGGHGLNECYKIIEGLPPSCIISIPSSGNEQVSLASVTSTSIHVKIDVSNLSTQQIIKVCQNFVKYEESMDSFVPWRRREGRCAHCRSNKEAMEGYDTNKRRNQRISKCETLEELTDCLNPKGEHRYKLSLRGLLRENDDARRGEYSSSSSLSNKNASVEFRQHPSSKDKTTITHWIRFCTAFVRNSARLRSPTALKATTSIEEEFDLLFEYVVKDRALRNFYKERRDALATEEEAERNEWLKEEMAKRKESTPERNASESFGSMRLSGGGGEGSDNLRMTSARKRDDSPSQMEGQKRTCLR